MPNSLLNQQYNTQHSSTLNLNNNQIINNNNISTDYGNTENLSTNPNSGFKQKLSLNNMNGYQKFHKIYNTEESYKSEKNFKGPDEQHLTEGKIVI